MECNTFKLLKLLNSNLKVLVGIVYHDSFKVHITFKYVNYAFEES